MTTTDATGAYTVPASSIVVATDGSEHAGRAVHWAADQAALERRPLIILTFVHGAVMPAAGIGAMSAVYSYSPQDLLDSGQALAREAIAAARGLHPGLEVTGFAQIGEPRHLLIELSRTVHMIVLGSRGRGLFCSKLLGSVSAAVSRDASCPVVVCRPQRTQQHPAAGILVGADGTPESLPVVEFAFRQASLTGQPLTVVHAVWDAVAAAQGPGAVSPAETALEEYRVLLAESVAGIAPKFPEVEVELRLTRGMAEDCLRDTSGEWSLIVVGRHPVDTFARLVTGAVATAVVERSHSNVAVVPETRSDAGH